MRFVTEIPFFLFIYLFIFLLAAILGRIQMQLFLFNFVKMSTEL